MSDIRTEIANLRDAAERYRAEATALHASLLLHIEGLETKLTTPLPTGPELYLPAMSAEMRGAPVVLVTYGRSQDVEDYVRALARRSGQPCDWGFSCGRAVIHSTGDVDKVAAAIEDLHWMCVMVQHVSGGLQAAFEPVSEEIAAVRWADLSAQMGVPPNQPLTPLEGP